MTDDERTKHLYQETKKQGSKQQEALIESNPAFIYVRLMGRAVFAVGLLESLSGESLRGRDESSERPPSPCAIVPHARGRCIP